MIKPTLNENNIRTMAELAVRGAKHELGSALHIGDKKEMNLAERRKKSLIDCLERLNFADLIKEIK